jgi:CRP/FNR family transcriptional regulator, cyclic AMP receptor protein
MKGPASAPSESLSAGRAWRLKAGVGSRKSPVPKQVIKEPSALYLTEVLSELNQGAGFLDQLSLDDIQAVRSQAVHVALDPGEPVFLQGDPHKGIFLIEKGRVRTYYAGPSGKEVTLAYWTAGHFVGGPEVFGGGVHMWSATAVEATRLSFLSGAVIRRMVQTIPAFAICLIEALAAKGKCYSALAQMLGTRSVVERVAQLLLVLAQIHGRTETGGVVIDREITQEQIAAIVGSTRQWVTTSFQRFEKRRIISVHRNTVIIHSLPELAAFASGGC